MGIPFDKKELEATGVAHLKTALLNQDVKIYHFPTTAREGYMGPYRGRPIWVNYLVETQFVNPYIIPDNIARGVVTDAALTNEEKGGPDMFGIEWEFVPTAGGSMVRPGKPLLEEVSEWREKVRFPDIDSWDWAGAGKRWQENHDPAKAQVFTLVNGFWFERLISFMDFENAAVALITEEDQEELHALFSATTDLACRLVDKICQYFQIDIINVHDDWGSMKNSFFSPKVCAEMIVPYMRKLTDHIHSKGVVADLHSCGKIDNQVQNMIDAGWDSWTPMDICDTEKIFDTYGDKMIFGVMPERFDPKTASEEEQRGYARRFVEKYCRPDKYARIGNYAIDMLTPAFLEELYVGSRRYFAQLY